MENLSLILWRERELLETLRETEVLRSLAADEAAASVGMGSNPSLRAQATARRATPTTAPPSRGPPWPPRPA